MTVKTKTILDLGEKKIISEIIKPLINPLNLNQLAGDDCALIATENKDFISTSTDRVPADLLCFKLGLINYKELGEYLAILNISDVLSSGAIPKGLLLNLAFPNDFLVNDLRDIILGALQTCEKYNCEVVGGDLSHSIEMSLSATIIGLVNRDNTIYRRGARAGDNIFCSNIIGLTPTAFEYFINAKPNGMTLLPEEEDILINQFKNLQLNIELIEKIRNFNGKICGMDNTDGVAQSFLELSEINKLSFVLDRDKIKIHSISKKVADYLKMDVLDLVLSGGADFQLLGTVSASCSEKQLSKLSESGLEVIGTCQEGETGVFIKELGGEVRKCNIRGWNYFNKM